MRFNGYFCSLYLFQPMANSQLIVASCIYLQNIKPATLTPREQICNLSFEKYMKLAKFLFQLFRMKLTIIWAASSLGQNSCKTRCSLKNFCVHRKVYLCKKFKLQNVQIKVQAKDSLQLAYSI